MTPNLVHTLDVGNLDAMLTGRHAALSPWAPPRDPPASPGAPVTSMAMNAIAASGAAAPTNPKQGRSTLEGSNLRRARAGGADSRTAEDRERDRGHAHRECMRRAAARPFRPEH